MFRQLAAFVFCGLAVMVASAQDTKWQPPPTPEGWKVVSSKDGIYRYFIPQESGRSGTRDQTINAGGVRMRSQIGYHTLKSGLRLEVEVATLSGAGTRGLTPATALNNIVDGMKEEGFKVGEPKEVKVGAIKAQEYRMGNDKETHRTVMFVVRPRIFILTAAAANPALVDGEPANTFLHSLFLVPPDVVKAAAKERAVKDEAAGKENLEKYGAKWTMALKDMTPPEGPARGLLRGKEFKPDAASIQGGNLELKQGAGVFPEGQVTIFFLYGNGESVENKNFEIPPGTKPGVSKPHIHISTMEKNARVPKAESFVDKYALKVTFGAKGSNGEIPGTIYLCTPDAKHSFVAGSFTVKAK